MFFDHKSKSFIGLESGPLQVIHPGLEEFASPCLGRIVPQMSEGFLEQVCLEELWTVDENFIKSLPAFSGEMSVSAEENEFLSRKKAPEPSSGLSEFILPYGVKCGQQVPDYMELIVDDLDIGAVGFEAFNKPFPHIHYSMSNFLGSPLAEPFPELFEIFFLSAFADMQQLRSPRPFKRRNQMPALVSFAHENLVSSQDCYPVQWPGILDTLEDVLVDVFYSPPMESLQYGNRLHGRDFAKFMNVSCKSVGDTAIQTGEGQFFCLFPTVGALDPVLGKSQEGQVLKKPQVLYLSRPVFDNLLRLSTALGTDTTGGVGPFQVDDSDCLSVTNFPFHIYYLEPFNSQALCEKMFQHLAALPEKYMAMYSKGDFSLPDASISNTYVIGQHSVMSQKSYSNIILFVIESTIFKSEFGSYAQLSSL
jgi:hypothetical protein